MPSPRFILQAIDPDCGHPAFETMFTVDRPDELRALLGPDAEDDPDFDKWYRLEPAEVVAISQQCGVTFEPDGRATTLFRWHHENMPYLVHSGYELALMVDRRKPFAHFNYIYYPPYDFGDEERFDRYVDSGLLHKEVQLDPFAEPLRLPDGRVYEGFRHVRYTLKGEEWRIAAWKLVTKAARKEGWNDSFDRLEGMLLGYEDWQNDWWIERRRRTGHQFGRFWLHLAVTANERAAIENTGYRAFPSGDRPLLIFATLTAELRDDERHSLLAKTDAVAMVRFRVKARAFLSMATGDPQAARHELPPERVKDLNRLIEGEIEVLDG